MVCFFYLSAILQVAGFVFFKTQHLLRSHFVSICMLVRCVVVPVSVSICVSSSCSCCFDWFH